ncbi:MAG: hypothetical protein VYA30_05745, partial [Myxococcota bacterium]|nr:hypothetical protein [Myxococcota bacterium]
MSERIRELYEAIKNNPADAVARQGLVDEFTTQQDWPGLLDLHLFIADHSDDPSTRASWRHAAAEVAEKNLNDPIRAIELYNSSLDDDPDGVLVALAQMRRLLRVIEDWENYVEVAQNELELTEDGESASLILLEMGDVFENSIGDLDNAMECYQVAFQYDNRCVKALWATRRISRDKQDWQAVCESLQIELELSQEANAQVDILRELAGLYARELDSEDQAESCYRRLLELQPDDQAALKFLGSHFDGESNEEGSDTVQVVATDFERETMVGSPSLETEENHESGLEFDEPDDLLERDTELHQPVDSLAADDGETPGEHAASDPSAEFSEPDEISSGLSDEIEGESRDAESDPLVSVDQSDSQLGDDGRDSVAADEADLVEDDGDNANDNASVDPALESAPMAEIIEEQVEEPAPDAEERLEIFLEREALADDAEGDERIERLLDALEYADGESAGQYYPEVVAARPDDIGVYWRVGRALRLSASQAQSIAAKLDDLATSQPDAA